MRPATIGLSLAALGLSTALASVTALAQTYPTGRAANDGGFVSAQTQPQTAGQRTGSASNDQAARPGGSMYAFGGQGQPPAAEYHYPIGRAADDGGLTTAQEQKGAERTGSTSNREAFRSGTESYQFGAQGQPPRMAPGPYGYTGGGLYAYGGQWQQPGQEYHYPMGRAANDGGLTTAQEQKGAERTGSTSNREAFRSGRESYQYGGQGQPPRMAPGPYGQ